MRRALAISLAILVVMIAARGVMAQDAEQSATDRLLEILKSRQIISEGEFSELKELAGNMEAERNDVDARLGALDRSISDYLAKDGDGVGSNVTYQPGGGFTFGSTDNAFSLTVGGTFIMHYLGLDINEVSGSKDTNNFNITQNRIHFSGHAFDPAMRFYIEFDAAPARQATFLGVPVNQLVDEEMSQDMQDLAYLQASGFSIDEYGTTRLWEAYLDYELCEWTTIRAGQMKVPYGRQWQTHVGDLGFAEWDPVSQYFNFGRDVGVMLHDHIAISEGSDAVFQYNLGMWNGEGNTGNDHSYVAWAIRGAIDPFGYVDPAEGDWTGGDFRASLGGTYYQHQMRFDAAKVTAYEVDFAAKFMGFYLIAEWFQRDFESDSSDDIKNSGWYAQLQYMIIPKQLEVMGRVGMIDYDKFQFSAFDFPIFEDSREWAVGLAWYFSESHAWKTVLEFGGAEHSIREDGGDNPSFNFLRLAIQLQW